MAIYSYGVCGRYSPSLYRHTATTWPLHPLEPFWARVCSRPAENAEDWLEDIGKNARPVVGGLHVICEQAVSISRGQKVWDE